jgi:hypothetical protein
VHSDSENDLGAVPFGAAAALPLRVRVQLRERCMMVGDMLALLRPEGQGQLLDLAHESADHVRECLATTLIDQQRRYGNVREI